MNKTTLVGLSGQTQRFQLDDDAYGRLTRYLDQAARRLQDDPDRTEVLDDLERSIGTKLAAAVGAEDRVLTVGDIDTVIQQIGTVDTGREPAPGPEPTAPRRRRRLRRIKEGQQIAGVCTGLADYSEIDVDWVRTIFILGALVTAGLLIVAYIAMAFILPIDPTRDATS